MRYWVYDEDGILIRKFYSRDQAEAFLLSGWRLVVQPKPKKHVPSVETHGEALW
jgi:hypothetical protein